MKTKVCMLTAVHHPAIDARIFQKEAQSLYKAGFEVSLVAPMDKDGFFTDWAGNRVAQWEADIDGIRVVGFTMGNDRIFNLPKTGRINQLLATISYGRLYFAQNRFSDIINKGVQIDADVYHCHEPESLYAGAQIKQRLKKLGGDPKLIYDVHEFWPGYIYRQFNKRYRRIWDRLERENLAHTDYVITANHITRGYLLSLNRFIKVEVIENCPAFSIFGEYDHVSSNDEIVICHEGSLSFERGLKEMLEVVKILKERYNGRAKFLIVGDVFNVGGGEREYFEQKIKEYQIGDVLKRTGWLPYERVGEAISNCSIGIILMEPTENNMLAGPPNKLFNYMRYGMPIITVDLPETRRIILESQCGIIVKERTVDAFVSALSMLIEDSELRFRLSENAKKAIHEKYNWEIMEKKLLRIYGELTSPSKYIIADQKTELPQQMKGKPEECV